MKRFFQIIWKQIKRVPWYAWIISGIIFGLNCAFYRLAHVIVHAWSDSWKVIPITQGIDDKIPLVPYFFIQVYWAWFPMAIIGPLVCAVTKKERYLNLVLAWLAAEIIGFIVFICCPSYMDRTNVAGVGNMMAIEEGKGGLSWAMLRITNISDGGKDNYILFPSFHCLLITFSYLGMHQKKEIKIGYRIFWLISAILICLSTIFTKQHYFFDVITGVLLAIVMNALFQATNPGKHILKKCPNFLIIKKLNWTHERITKSSFGNK